jgi:hypothetical protein
MVRPYNQPLKSADVYLLALLIRQWLDANPTQLTYCGLFALSQWIRLLESIIGLRIVIRPSSIPTN